MKSLSIPALLIPFLLTALLFQTVGCGEGSGSSTTDASMNTWVADTSQNADVDANIERSVSEDAWDGHDTPTLWGPDASDAPSGAALDTAGQTDGEGTEGPDLSCLEGLPAPLGWFADMDTEELPGHLEFGQTHVIEKDELRHAPPLTEGRETLLLFTPDTPFSSETEPRVAAFEGENLLGVLAMEPPDGIPGLLEQSLTSVALSPYSSEAWSTTLPWAWVREGIHLEIASQDDAVLRVHTYVFENLGAPHETTISRAAIVLFGEEDFETSPLAATKLVSDFFGSVPGASMTFVEHSPWRLEEMVVNTLDGPRMAHSEEERLAITSDTDRWNILKHQFALRLSLANTGRGLSLTQAHEGDSSPYSFGTSVGLGWVRDAAGNYVDINNAPWAAGWTGWAGLWLGECGNAFIHELGHSFTLAHFVGGTAAGWNIADEYPQDGTNLASHPWGYDTTRRQFRTWYRVDSSGPVMDGENLVGKRDPMNGGESGNAITCFPQYTGYHAEKIQAWQESSPTIALVDGVPGIYRFNPETQSYEPELPAPGHGAAIAVDEPVVTLIGTLGNVDEACQTYPPMFAASGNVFALPDPEEEGLAVVFTGARWFLEIGYADGSMDRALIARGEITDASLYLYSLNLSAGRTPVKVDLYASPTAYPDIDLAAAELKHSRALSNAKEALPPVVKIGQGWLANGSLLLTARCTAGINCETRRQQSTWQVSDEALHFHTDDDVAFDTSMCNVQDSFTTLNIPVLDASGQTQEITVHAQRVLTSGAEEMAVAMNDVTPWFEAPNLRQSLRVWMPYEENKNLPEGHYVNDGEYLLNAFLGEDMLAQTAIEIDLVVYELTPVNLATEFQSEGLTAIDSSLYYVLQDAAIGPTGRVWWDDGNGLPTSLYVPVIDSLSGNSATLLLDAQKEACGDRWDLNTGQAADWGCAHRVVISVAAAGNEALESGHTYQSPGSHPVVVEGRRWHAPNAKQLIDTFAFDISYTVP